MSKFKVGDRVIGNSQLVTREYRGKVGTVFMLAKDDRQIHVEWDTGGRDGGFWDTKFDRYVEPQTATPTTSSALPTDSTERKRWPLYSGLLAYFPAALAQVAHHSFLGNEKHNPGLPLQHARGVSGDHQDCIMRHLVDAMEHPAGSAQRVEELRALCWRGLALLQEESELAGAPAAPAASFDRVKK